MIIIIRLRSMINKIESINLGWFELQYLTSSKAWPYFLLVPIEICNIVFTSWGSVLFFNSYGDDLETCSLEYPTLVTFLLVFLMIGYIFFLRMIATVCHFIFGA